MNKLLRKFQSITTKKSFALKQLDFKLDSYLKLRRGFFIEAGANDGISQSNTLYFEKYKNWKGLLIEAIPELAEKCRINRPRCIVENCALVPFDFNESYIEMNFCNLMSVVKGAMKSQEEELKHLKKGCEIQQVTSYNIKVPANTLTTILSKHSIQNIDFLSLDVEGFELSVLKGIDFEKYQPTWMLIEARYKDEIDAFLKPLYEPVAELSHHDVLYKKRKL
ncbi:FkbM family methyltransferase [Oxynema aestuarii]|uniref:FkbM family methyltransferase n=1 Tax=Oxynema aestuarii AP17 TaxID=2064643 RepID=A0A6H1U1H6_9CYAN|nr:FkbM family methyltransferase [Oxynema aestuarii]QIZ72505.1 FkbM family methyltransferase [Oxynema aestuarii AP17]